MTSTTNIGPAQGAGAAAGAAQTAGHGDPASPVAVRVKAIESLLARARRRLRPHGAGARV